MFIIYGKSIELYELADAFKKVLFNCYFNETYFPKMLDCYTVLK